MRGMFQGNFDVGPDFLTMRQSTGNQSSLYNVWLYRTVFFSSWRWLLGSVLLAVLFLQPLHQVFADEDTDFESVDTPELVEADIADDGVPDLVEDEEETPDEVTPETDVSNSDEVVNEEFAEDANTEDQSVSATEESNDEALESDTADEELPAVETDTASTSDGDIFTDDVASASSSQSSGDGQSESTSTPTTSGQSSSGGTSSNEAPSANTVDQEPLLEEGTLEEEIASTTVIETVVVEHVQSSNRFQFSEDQCVSVGGGAYHCTDTTTGTATDNDIVFTQVNNQGFTDVMLRTARETITITDGQADAGGPFYDPVSETVVWHQSVAGRYQIFAYDIRARETKQLTNTNENNMQPVRSGQRTVWQQWHNDYWQVALFDGSATTLLTDTQAHNVAPAINGNFIIWQTTSLQGVRQVAVYDLDTGLISYIDDSEGGRITNPRFVLVYDAQLPNGDMIVRGFDPETGGVVPFGSVPAVPLPDIPTPDPVGEPRALPANKYEGESDDIVELPKESGSSTDSSMTDDINADLDLQTSSSTELIELTEYDVVVTPYVASSSESVASSSSAHTNGGESGE